MVYDTSLGKLVLFGVLHSGGPETWTYDGSTWTQQFPPTTAPTLSGTSMAYDAAIDKVVLFGGESNDVVKRADVDV